MLYKVAAPATTGLSLADDHTGCHRDGCGGAYQ